MLTRPISFAALVVTACSTTATLPPVRFVNGPVVTAVNDRRDVTKQPEPREFLPSLYNYVGTIERPLARTMDLHRSQRAQGVNALDEVPDSTWFTNRIGTRDLSLDEIRSGPLTVDSPELHRPWTVRSTKGGGTSIGFIVVDARGIKYLLKFDDAGYPEIETGIDVMVNRLMWAIGYNVAEDEIVYFHDQDLVLAPDASIKDGDGNKIGVLDRAGLEKLIGSVDHGKDGRIRGLMSRWIEGKTIGGHSSEGVRWDDPNDVIPHELRRELRGAYPIFAWLDHVDLHEGNFVDSWVTDPGDKHRHYVKHYFVDFGRSLGAMALFSFDWRRGHTYVVDFTDIGRTLFTLGLLDRDWQHRPLVPGPNLPSFDATTFDPSNWHPDWPAYVPVEDADHVDKFWGAKLVARFTRPQIEAAVSAARFSDPAVVKYLVDTLLARQRATAAYWFTRVAPLDHFAVGDGFELCFDDLALVHQLADASATRYAITSYDWSARQVAAPVGVAGTRTGRACTHVAAAPATDDGGYTILRITTTRPDLSGETFVHLARDPASGIPRLIGVWRP